MSLKFLLIFFFMIGIAEMGTVVTIKNKIYVIPDNTPVVIDNDQVYFKSPNSASNNGTTFDSNNNYNNNNNNNDNEEECS
ncbi:small heat shock protein hspM-like [Microplitis mediator]|uniref:small heat shock protein hspM-like n=1 Tax=Microplitis mediator TaxID=375433 RepID=UPI002556432A|nr:small heat shock protein hspM-like [Microplitis mediator]